MFYFCSMPEIHKLDRHCYGQDALETWRRRGATTVEFWCVGNTMNCSYWFATAIEAAIEHWGPGTSLVMLARRARCKACGKKGCHVQVTSRLSNGDYNWNAAAEKHLVMARC